MEDNIIFDPKKVGRLIDTINDFLLGTKLTNVEIDYVLNHIWMSVQSSRVAAMAVDRIPNMLVPIFSDEPEAPKSTPGYIR